MTLQILLGTFFALVAIWLLSWLQSQLLIRAYREGFLRGRQESADWCATWWSKVEKQVEEGRQEIQDEGRWP